MGPHANEVAENPFSPSYGQHGGWKERLVTAKQLRYWEGAVKVLVPAGCSVRVTGNTFSYVGYLGEHDSAQLPSLLSQGVLEQKR